MKKYILIIYAIILIVGLYIGHFVYHCDAIIHILAMLGAIAILLHVFLKKFK